MKLVFSKVARKDLERLKDFILIKNPIAATKVINELIAGLDHLIIFPDLGIPVQDAPTPDSVRDIFLLDYHARYLKLQNVIYIIRIWHQKEDR